MAIGPMSNTTEFISNIRRETMKHTTFKGAFLLMASMLSCSVLHAAPAGGHEILTQASGFITTNLPIICYSLSGISGVVALYNLVSTQNMKVAGLGAVTCAVASYFPTILGAGAVI